ncbi:transposase, partial [Paenibacillus enshidis]
MGPGGRNKEKRETRKEKREKRKEKKRQLKWDVRLETGTYVWYNEKKNLCSWIMDYGLWIMDYGLWIMDYGLWIMDYGLWIRRRADMGVQAETELQPFSRRYHNEQACMEALIAMKWPNGFVCPR